jgi:hypothetical protein
VVGEGKEEDGDGEDTRRGLAPESQLEPGDGKGKKRNLLR